MHQDATEQVFLTGSRSPAHPLLIEVPYSSFDRNLPVKNKYDPFLKSDKNVEWTHSTR